ncbi:hypothetical protein [Lentibacillus sediminis]|uniref:hypothetical protein n=1 Tax=Lentibacillus sediminis TaxID=1940529 RepID=UPI000C1C70F8|nr:hypothetical protein [Lentibacillus sediminis]
MYEELNERLIKLKAELRKKRKWEKQLTDYTLELSEMERILTKLEKKQQEEQADVEKLEGASFANLLATIKGTKEEKLDKEKQEAAAVVIQLQEAKKTKAEITAAMTDLEHNLHGVKQVEEKYHAVLSSKEKVIKESSTPSAEKLYDLSEQEADIRANRTELEEAIAAGTKVKQALEKALSSLEGAQNWGTLDMFGGGAITGAVKHSHIDEAASHIHVAQTRMRDFQKELLDIEEESSLEVDMSGLLKFADFFFDGFIVDWMVQGNISDSLNETSNQLTKINSLIDKLKKQVRQEEENLSRVLADKKRLVETL